MRTLTLIGLLAFVCLFSCSSENQHSENLKYSGGMSKAELRRFWQGQPNPRVVTDQDPSTVKSKAIP